MKRRFYSIVTLLLTLLLSVFVFVGCNQNQGSAKAEIVSKSDTMVVIKINETEGFATLLDAMNYLKNDGKLSFELSGTLVSSIEGKANSDLSKSYWMLYTSDAEMANTQWGTIEYGGNTYGSAILGAESLLVSVGAYYVWSYAVVNYN